VQRGARRAAVAFTMAPAGASNSWLAICLGLSLLLLLVPTATAATVSSSSLLVSHPSM